MKEDEIQALREENETLRRDLQRRIQASDGELALQKQVPRTFSNLSDDIEVGTSVTIVSFLFTNPCVHEKYIIQSILLRYEVFSLDGNIVEGLLSWQQVIKLSC